MILQRQPPKAVSLSQVCSPQQQPGRVADRSMYITHMCGLPCCTSLMSPAGLPGNLCAAEQWGIQGRPASD